MEPVPDIAPAPRSLFVPNATVFVASFCVMVLELVAGRIVARHLGSSLYTWTSVIGVVLAGIAVGNYLGGRLADRFEARRTLACAFLLSSALSVAIVMANRLVGGWDALNRISWPAHVALHVALVFFLPMLFLGMIGPVVATMALELKRKTGRTIGGLYAWGVIGSIVGTFLTGFYLIAVLGSSAIVWIVAGILAAMGLCFGWSGRGARTWAGLLVILALLGNSPAAWAQKSGVWLALRAPHPPGRLFFEESCYSSVEVMRLTTRPETRGLYLDRLLHGQENMEHPTELIGDYFRIYAAVTHRMSAGLPRIRTLTIGGGAYVYPLYLEATWPGSDTEVAEIDPVVTKAAQTCFGLPANSRLKIVHEDGRVYVDDLVRRRHRGENIPGYDFIYIDAFNDYSVPFQLTTREFLEHARELMAPRGVFMLNLIDVYDQGLFLPAMLVTLDRVFPHVYLFTIARSQEDIQLQRNTFIFAASRAELDCQDLGHAYRPDLEIRRVSDSDLAALRRRIGDRCLTDDCAPVENYLSIVLQASAREFSADLWLSRADDYRQRGDFAGQVACLRQALRVEPKNPTVLRRLQGLVEDFVGQAEESKRRGDWSAYAAACHKALIVQEDRVDVRRGLGLYYARIGRIEEALEQFRAILQYKPGDAKAHNNLGAILAGQDRMGEALKQFAEAVKFDPNLAEARLNYGCALGKAGRWVQAVEQIEAAVRLDPNSAETRAELESARKRLKP